MPACIVYCLAPLVFLNTHTRKRHTERKRSKEITDEDVLYSVHFSEGRLRVSEVVSCRAKLPGDSITLMGKGKRKIVPDVSSGLWDIYKITMRCLGV